MKHHCRLCCAACKLIQLIFTLFIDDFIHYVALPYVDDDGGGDLRGSEFRGEGILG